MFPRLPKSLILLFFIFVVVLVFSLSADSILAANIVPPVTAENVRPSIKVNFGSFTIANFSPVSFKGGENVEIPWIGQYIGGWYRYLVGIAGILAVIMIMVGGVFWLMAGGSPDKIGRAKEYITGALTGLVLALFSYVLLYTLNPRLTTFEPINVQVIAGININTAPGQCPSNMVKVGDGNAHQCNSQDAQYVDCRLFTTIIDLGVKSSAYPSGQSVSTICCCPTDFNVVGCMAYQTKPKCEEHSDQCEWYWYNQTQTSGYCIEKGGFRLNF